MKSLKARTLIGIAAIALVTACGGGEEDDGTQIVIFGDSLSDVGTYRTPGIAALGGGQYTVNGAPVDPLPATNWTEDLAVALHMPAPCAARTGLEASGPLAGLAAPTADHPGCTSYAQGGARVTNPVGPWNKALLQAGDPSGYLGQLTEPVTSQVANHLQRAKHGRFSPHDFVMVWAGANDLFMQLFQLQAAVAAGADPKQASQNAVAAMGTAGAELAAIVRDSIVGKGAQRVLVMTVPDAGLSPFGASQDASTRALMTTMASTFNAALNSGLGTDKRIVVADAFGMSQEEVASPSDFLLSNASTPACDLAKTAFPSSLACSNATLVTGDVSQYLFADDVHPTPWGHLLSAALAYEAMAQAGWVEQPTIETGARRSRDAPLRIPRPIVYP